MNCISRFVVLWYYEVKLRLRFKMNILYITIFSAIIVKTYDVTITQISYRRKEIECLVRQELPREVVAGNGVDRVYTV
jgi:hypothetical protein